MLAAAQASPFALEEVDLARMRRERLARLRAEMQGQGVETLLLLGGTSVAYATGALWLNAEEGHAVHERVVALISMDGEAPHLFTPYPEGVPSEIPPDHVHPPLYPEFEEGIDDLVRRVSGALGSPPRGKVGIDEYTAAMFARLPSLFDGAEVADGSAVVRGAKLLKTADEIECIRRAQRINEIAMYDAQAALIPGVRQSDLTGIFLQRIFELGASGNTVDPIWQVMPSRIADLPWTTNGDVAFPTVSTDRILRDGEVIWVDSGIAYHGYASDFGRSWIVGDPPQVTDRQRSQCRRWRDVVSAVLEVTRPGATAAELGRAAISANGGRKPWLKHFYLAHGVGTDSAEMPLIGTDLGDQFDEAIVLAAGMVFVLEPVIWEDGEGGYRSEDIVAVTEEGHALLSDYPYSPYE
jgi:Xaa-Pro aminopeptidase